MGTDAVVHCYAVEAVGPFAAVLGGTLMSDDTCVSVVAGEDVTEGVTIGCVSHEGNPMSV